MRHRSWRDYRSWQWRGGIGDYWGLGLGLGFGIGKREAGSGKREAAVAAHEHVAHRRQPAPDS
ncbi:hypothetical protein EIQ28_14905 [Xanthomonas campestris pv. plantaginis]